jgi:hypothetical protein
VYVGEVRGGGGERSPTSYATLLDWRERSSSFAALEGYNGSNPVAGTGDGAQRLRGAQVTAGFFRLLGVQMSQGRDSLLVGSFRNLVARDIGLVDPESLLNATVGLYGERYESFAAQRQFFNELIPAAAALPGVRAASAINELPGQTSTVIGRGASVAARTGPASRSHSRADRSRCRRLSVARRLQSHECFAVWHHDGRLAHLWSWPSECWPSRSVRRSSLPSGQRP